MRAWRVHGFGEPAETFVLEDVPEPTGQDLGGMSMDLGGWVPAEPGRAPFADWVLMRMSTAALALPDVTMCRGTYPVPVARPYVSGQEGVGVVVDAAPGRHDLLGQRVVACTIQPFGSLAPLAVGVSMIFPVPGVMDDVEAAGYLIPAHTAYHAVVRRGQVQAGETVVVLGAAGGLGSAMVQLCVARGAHVIAVVGGTEKARFCAELGAEVVDHQATAFVDAVLAIAPQGVDVVMDPVQGAQGAAARRLLAPGGRHVLCGHAGGLVPHDPDFYLHNHTLVGVDLGGYPPAVMQRFHAEAHEALSALLEQGRYRPIVPRVVEFGAVPQALSDMAARRTIGRVAVRVPAT